MTLADLVLQRGALWQRRRCTLGRFYWALSAHFIFFSARVCFNSCLIGAWNFCTTKKYRESLIKILISSRWCLFVCFFGVKCWCRTRLREGKIKTTWHDNDQTRKREQKLPSGNVIRFVEAKNAIWSTLSTCGAGLLLPLRKDICNWCQGPINHPVSKRPCNGFYISTYVESERVCHRCEPLSG